MHLLLVIVYEQPCKFCIDIQRLLDMKQVQPAVTLE